MLQLNNGIIGVRQTRSFLSRNESREEQAERRKREAELLALLLLFRGDMIDLGRGIVSGRIGQDQAAVEAQRLFMLRHSAAALIGVGLAAQQINRPVANFAYSLMIGQQVALGQEQFFRGLVVDAKEGRYDPKDEGGSGEAALNARMQLYANRLVGTANASWLQLMAVAGVECRWLLGHNENHCRDCVFESTQGWRFARFMRRVPGDGGTVCITNCKCRLITREGGTSFALSTERGKEWRISRQ